MPTPFPSSWDVYIIVSKKQEQKQPKQNGLRDGVDDSRDDQDRPESIITMIAALLAAAQAGALETETQGTGEASLFIITTTSS